MRAVGPNQVELCEHREGFYSEKSRRDFELSTLLRANSAILLLSFFGSFFLSCQPTGPSGRLSCLPASSTRIICVHHPHGITPALCPRNSAEGIFPKEKNTPYEIFGAVFPVRTVIFDEKEVIFLKHYIIKLHLKINPMD